MNKKIFLIGVILLILILIINSFYIVLPVSGFVVDKKDGSPIANIEISRSVYATLPVLDISGGTHETHLAFQKVSTDNSGKFYFSFDFGFKFPLTFWRKVHYCVGLNSEEYIDLCGFKGEGKLSEWKNDKVFLLPIGGK